MLTPQETIMEILAGKGQPVDTQLFAGATPGATQYENQECTYIWHRLENTLQAFTETCRFSAKVNSQYWECVGKI